MTTLLATSRRRAEKDRQKLQAEFESVIKLIVQETRTQSNNAAAVQEQQLDLLEKAFAQLRATNAWEYQSIMSMNGAPAYDEEYDPSPEADALRIADRQSTKDELDESLTAEEAAVLGDIFPGSF